jgi:hypothetical protein
VAHEINNPLSGVLTYTRLTSRLIGDKGPDPAKVPDIQNYLSTVASEVARCGRIVSNLLEFSRQTGVKPQAADLNDVVDKTLFLIAHKLELQGVTLTKDFLPGRLEIVCDTDQIRQALLAVFINAMEAMSEGGQLTVQIFPESVLGGVFRVDRQWMPDAAVEALGVSTDPLVLTAGTRFDPTEAVHVAMDVREAWPAGGGEPALTGTLLVAFQLPGEPSDDFSVRDSEE